MRINESKNLTPTKVLFLDSLTLTSDLFLGSLFRNTCWKNSCFESMIQNKCFMILCFEAKLQRSYLLIRSNGSKLVFLWSFSETKTRKVNQVVVSLPTSGYDWSVQRPIRSLPEVWRNILLESVQIAAVPTVGGHPSEKLAQIQNFSRLTTISCRNYENQ